MPNETHPPTANSTQGQKYIKQLVELVNQDRLEADHSDLTKFDASCMQDHYRINLDRYEVELSHSKHPETGEDVYILLFNGLKSVKNEGDRVILSYVHVTKDQFETLKEVCDKQAERLSAKREEERFHEVMKPIDQALEEIPSAHAAAVA